MQRLVILGGGFAGVWAALGASKMRRQYAEKGADVEIVLVSRDRWLTIRPRLYEATLGDARVPLDDALGPAGVDRVEGEIVQIDASARTVAIDGADGPRTLSYDRLLLAAGSHVKHPAIAGGEHAFLVDTFADAHALDRHLASLSTTKPGLQDEARFSAVVVGAGFTGIEVATTLVARLRSAAAGTGTSARVVLVDRASALAPDLGAAARQHVERTLVTLGIESRVDRAVSAIDPTGILLNDGEWIPAHTVVWTGGFRASGLVAELPVERDELGRVPVDDFLRVRGLEGIYAAGDVARAMADATHVAPMSCQYAIPMGETAGVNAAADLLGVPLVPFAQPDYVTCLDLGEGGALFMQGWDRDVRLTGSWAKLLKATINQRLIYPPRARSDSPVDIPPRARTAA